jgi:hypothetical protein
MNGRILALIRERNLRICYSVENNKEKCSFQKSAALVAAEEAGRYRIDEKSGAEKPRRLTKG